MNPRSLNEQDPLPKFGEKLVPGAPPSPPNFVPTKRPGVYKDRQGKLFTMVLENEQAPEDWVAAEKARRWTFEDWHDHIADAVSWYRQVFNTSPHSEDADVTSFGLCPAVKARQELLAAGVDPDDNGLDQWLSEHKARQDLFGLRYTVTGRISSSEPSPLHEMPRKPGIDPYWTPAAQAIIEKRLSRRILVIGESCSKTDCEDGLIAAEPHHVYVMDPVTGVTTRVAPESDLAAGFDLRALKVELK